MARHVIVGKGPIGRTLAQHLAAQGHEVLVLSRSGGQPADAAPVGGISWDAVDATDGSALAAAASGADALYNCVNPAYHRWPTDWPPVADALLAAAERTGAILVTTGNLYGYGAGTEHMTESSAQRSTETKGRVRIAMWQEALRRHEAGRLRTTEIRGSDYIGPGAGRLAHVGNRMIEPLLAGRTLRPIGSADQPHTWTYLPDFAAALAAAAVTEDAWGHAWHAPSPEPLTFRQVAGRIAAAAGVRTPRVSPIPMAAVRALGVVSPMMREVAGVGYQFTAPFVMDSATSQAALDVAPTPWDEIVAATLAAWRSH